MHSTRTCTCLHLASNLTFSRGVLKYPRDPSVAARQTSNHRSVSRFVRQHKTQATLAYKKIMVFDTRSGPLVLCLQPYVPQRILPCKKHAVYILRV